LHVVNCLRRLEYKLDRLVAPNQHQPNQNSELYELQNGSGSTTSSPSIISPSIYYIGQELRQEQRNGGDNHKRLTYANGIFTWPAIQSMLLSTGVESANELYHMLESGTARFIELQLQKHPRPLSYNVNLRSSPITGLDDCIDDPRTIFPDLTMAEMEKYADTYFNSFNMIYPILDYDDFMQLVMPFISTNGFGDGCVTSILALSVFALGKLALEGTLGDPVSSDHELISGIREVCGQNPPGLDIFNEVRRRLGFVQTQCCLESAQILLLSA
jgi:hypothetical protein